MIVTDISDSLAKLDSSSTPLWGNFEAQQMVEHLEQAVMISNGKIKVKVYSPDNKLPALKAFLLSDTDMPINYESPVLKNGIPPLRHKDLDSAKKGVKDELLEFHRFFSENPDLTLNNPVFGALNYEEWKLFHQKHFSHHFRQFGLM